MGKTTSDSAPSQTRKSNLPATVPHAVIADDDPKEVLEMYRRRIKDAQRTNDMMALLDIVKELGSGTINNEALNIGIDVAPSGKILLPMGMTLLEAAKELRRRHLEEETEVDMTHMLDGWDPQDALVNLMKCISNEFGWVNALKTMFSQPTERKIQVGWHSDGSKRYESCYIGKFVISAWDKAEAQVAFSKDPQGRVRCLLKVTAKKKFRAAFSELVDKIERFVRENSIYKGQSLTWDGSTGEKQFEYTLNKGTNDIVLNPDEALSVDRLLIPQLQRKGKYISLFSGEYGTGKTETAMRVGRIANAAGITFIYARNSDLATLLELSRNYQPCVIFMEDVESVGKGSDRDHTMNTLLNTLDGFATKGNDLKVIFTTNHATQINKALRRAGRIDLIVNFTRPTAQTAARIYQVLLANTPTSEDIDYARFGELAYDMGVTGSTIAQVCQRAETLVAQADDGQLTNEVLEMAWVSMRHHIEFMNAGVEESVDHLRVGLTEVVRNAVGGEGANSFAEVLENTANEVAERTGDFVADKALETLGQIKEDLQRSHEVLGSKIEEVNENVARLS